MSYGKFMNELTETCTKVWSCPDVKDKRNLLKRAVATFKYKQKNAEFLETIAKATVEECDKIAANLILNKTDKVVALLPR